MPKEWIKEVPNWENDYLELKRRELSKQQVELLEGRENVKNFLNDNPTIAKEIENQILQNAGIVEKAMMEGKVDKKEEKEKEEIKE